MLTEERLRSYAHASMTASIVTTNYDPIIEVFVKAMQAEGKGPHDEMGWRARWIVWRELDALPVLRRASAWLRLALATVGTVVLKALAERLLKKLLGED
jgi:hypothetical protein